MNLLVNLHIYSQLTFFISPTKRVEKWKCKTDYEDFENDESDDSDDEFDDNEISNGLYIMLQLYYF